jgi:UDP:flavonoid glycosyltransferase YjiC (YdhE family)
MGIIPLSETSKDLPPAGLGLTPASNSVQKLLHAGLRTLTQKVLFSKSNKELSRMLAVYGLHVKDTGIFDLGVRCADVYLQSGTPSFEFKRSDTSPNVRFIGPLLPYAKKAQNNWYDDRLKKYRKVILVTQGTVETDVRKLLVPTLEAFKDTDYLVVATTGGSETEKLRQQYQHKNIIIEDFIPFECIMPFASVYVSNGGYGGVLLAIQHQLPLVVAGVHEGKNEINARIGYFDLGINLKTETPTVEQLRRSIDAVVQQPAYKVNVQALAAEFGEYQPEELFAEALVDVCRKKGKVQKEYLLEDAMSIY